MLKRVGNKFRCANFLRSFLLLVEKLRSHLMLTLLANAYQWNVFFFSSFIKKQARRRHTLMPHQANVHYKSKWCVNKISHPWIWFDGIHFLYMRFIDFKMRFKISRCTLIRANQCLYNVGCDAGYMHLCSIAGSMHATTCTHTCNHGKQFKSTVKHDYYH